MSLGRHIFGRAEGGTPFNNNRKIEKEKRNLRQKNIVIAAAAAGCGRYKACEAGLFFN